MTRPFFVLAVCASIFCAFSTQSTAAQPQHAGDTIRWEIDDQGASWIGHHIALGDHGSTLIAGKKLFGGSRIVLHSTASPQPIVDYFTADDLEIKVAAARAGQTLAAISSQDQGSQSKSTLRVWESAHRGAPDWEFQFPLFPFVANSAIGVCVSSDGQRIACWSTNSSLSAVDIRVFDASGSELLQTEITSTTSQEARAYDGVIDSLASRMLISLGGAPQLIDLTSGQRIQDWPQRSKRGGLAISNDGHVVAIGDLNSAEVFRENAQGSFTLARSYPLQGKRIGGPMALDSDGSHLAYSVNWQDNAVKTQVRVQDLVPDAELWRYELQAPNTNAPLWISDVHIAEDAEVVVASSWGDDARVTPTGFAFDRNGAVLSFFRTEGSILAMDYDPQAELAVYCSKDTHIIGFGPYGGDIICADVRPTELQVAGLPESTGVLNLTMNGVGNRVRVAAARSLGNSPTAYGVSQLDFGSLYTIFPSLPLTAGSATMQVPIPPSIALIGAPVHFQAALIVMHNTSGYLSNRISIRILP